MNKIFLTTIMLVMAICTIAAPKNHFCPFDLGLM